MQITAASTARRMWDRYLTTTRRETDEASDVYRSTTPPVLADRRATIVLITAVVVLLITNFGTDWHWIAGLAGFFGVENPDAAFTDSTNAEFNRLVWWAIVQISAYVVLPLLAIRYGLRGKPIDYGALGSFKHARVYLGLLAISIPVIITFIFAQRHIVRGLTAGAIKG